MSNSVQMTDLKPWLRNIYEEVTLPKRKVIENHAFVKNMQGGIAEKTDALRYFQGLMWHLLDFGKHVEHLMKKRPAEVTSFLESRSEDEDGDTEILGRIVAAFGGNPAEIAKNPWSQNIHPVWIQHDALLRSVIYSPDFSWQVGAAALNVGIEALVPNMIEPLFRACIAKYGVTSDAAQWLESRSGEAEKQHGENGFLILNHFVSVHDEKLQRQCRFFIESLSDSMAYGLLSSGLPLRAHR